MSKEIVKHKQLCPDWSSLPVLVVYIGPCFMCGMRICICVGSINVRFHPWNASASLAKKEYDRVYKIWGKRVMWTRGDNR